jgi:hypothetical protein
MKKHWIYIKRGLSEDPKHRDKMGECIWLYMHIIDQADWETGIAHDWKDASEAADMGMSVDTLRRQRQKLEDGKYIKSVQRQHGQDIYLYEWKNPRDYGSETKNPRNESLNETLPSSSEGLNQGLNQGMRQVKTPTYDSKSIPLKGIEQAILQNRPVTQEDINASSPKYRQLCERVEKLLKVTPNMSNPKWETVLNGIEKREKLGQSLDNYARWCKEDKFNSPKTHQIAKDPHCILDTWVAAFADEPYRDPRMKEWHDD